ncbi:Gfo/Idh/MocA family protein [Micromonospora eburnea]|uniref:Predicted dehydrogenase n=2 Tax=Micromonospora eburnea TaxID=227316 RepID=A0A1C6V0Z1_9ACTN|nr:Gfo/Idh/MocA family oxidoreductase [Micromonospora eburnea]SCL59951.1 Predicted dehydrogenase [Micromonospora eburnea]
MSAMPAAAAAPPVRFAVLGCADIAWRNILPAMSTVDDVRVVALASRDGAKAARFAGRFGGDPVEGYARAVDRPDVDAVYVALPTALHHTWTRRALDAGKHVLVEKPLTASLTDTEDLVGLARERGLVLMDGFQFLHHAQHAAVRTMVDQGRIGQLREFTAVFGIPPRADDDIRYRPDLGGGALLDVGVYPVRVAQLFLGPDLEVVGSLLRRDARRGVDISGAALLASPQGIPAHHSFSFAASYRSGYALWGSEGSLIVDRAFTPPATFRPAIRLQSQGTTEEIFLDPDNQSANLVRAFVRALRQGIDMESYGESLIRHAAVVDQIRDQARWTTIDGES